jgi:hypothetical protein
MIRRHATTRRRNDAPPLVLLLLCLFALVAPGCLSADEPTTRPRPAFHAPVAEILLDDPYPDLVVELDYVEPYRPSALATDELRRVLVAHTAKHNVTILEPQPIPSQRGSYTSQGLDAIQEEFADVVEEPGGAARLYIVYLNGRMREEDLWGIQFDPGAIALFPMYYDMQGIGPLLVQNSGLGLNKERLERAILVHETGHVMGLVGCAIPMVRPHEDPKSACHSSNRDSVMWFAIDGAAGGDVDDQLAGRFTFEFDADDAADIRAFIDAHPRSG